MLLINHPNKLDKTSDSRLQDHLLRQFDDLVETDEDPLPIFIIVESSDDITGPDYAFVSDNGLLGDDDNPAPYESITHLRTLNVFRLLLLLNGEDGYWIYVPDVVAFENPALASLLDSSAVD